MMAVLEMNRWRLRDINMLEGTDLVSGRAGIRSRSRGLPHLCSELLPWPGLEPGSLMPGLRGPAYITGLSHDQGRQ